MEYVSQSLVFTSSSIYYDWSNIEPEVAAEIGGHVCNDGLGRSYNVSISSLCL